MKLSHAVIVALAAALIAVSALFWASNRQHKAELAEFVAATAKLDSELNLSRSNETACSTAVARQNAALARRAVDTVLIEKQVSQTVTKYAYIRDTVKIMIEKEASCEDQMRYLDGVTRRFMSR